MPESSPAALIIDVYKTPMTVRGGTPFPEQLETLRGRMAALLA